MKCSRLRVALGASCLCRGVHAQLTRSSLRIVAVRPLTRGRLCEAATNFELASIKIRIEQNLLGLAVVSDRLVSVKGPGS